jgi:predicted naringenin-chalcone synthase
LTTAHINRIGTAIPAHDIHAPFVAFAKTLLQDAKSATVFERMAQRAGIDRRYSVMRAGDIAAGEVDAGGFYRRGAFPGTAARMASFETHAPGLALRAIEALGLGEAARSITHLIIASCTGFTAPGLDLQLARALGLRSDVERSIIGFMGCSAAVPALRAARQAVLAAPAARVLVVNLELCSLHLQETDDLETALSFLLFGDGCAASLVTADEEGVAMGDFRAAIIPESEELITWHIGDHGFLMHLSGKVPGRIAQALREDLARSDSGGILRGEGTQAVDLWAVHAGGRTVLDAVETGLSLDRHALADSRAILSAHGNMSSATIMFVLKRMMEAGNAAKRGVAMAFGPGMVAETFRFRMVE